MVVAVAVLGIGAVAATGRLGGMQEEPVRDTYRQQLPDLPLTAQDVAGLRFGVALRGYSMAQVDDVLERLGRELAERDARIAGLEQQLDERRLGPGELPSWPEPGR